VFATIETLRIVAAIAKDATYGVNAQIAVLVLDGADARPAAFPPGNILSQADQSVIVREKPAGGWPLLTIQESETGSRWSPEAPVGYREGSVDVDFLLAFDASGDAPSWLKMKYYEQAIVDSIEKGLLAADRSDSVRTRNNVQILMASQLSIAPFDLELGVARYTSVTKYRFDVRHNLS
jgi:hypothetical protein